MNKVNSYPRAPITEALFDIQVELPKKVTVADLDRLSSEISSDYPGKQARQRFAGRFELKASQGPVESIDLGIDGFLNWSSDKKQVVQFRLDGYTFSRVKPYIGWDEHFQEVVKNWNLYAKKLSPIRVKRVAVRFINIIELPLKNPMLNEYFISFPRAPIKTSVLSNFFNRMEFFLSDFDARATVTQTLAKSNSPTATPIILDLEVFREISSQPDIKMLSETFKVLRDIKNDIFQECLTQKTKDLFK